MEFDFDIWVAIASGGAILLATVTTTVLGVRQTRWEQRLQLRRTQASKDEVTEEVMARYREPLLRAAFDLQSRIFNVVRKNFLSRYMTGVPGDEDSRYAHTSTLYRIGQYFGWVELLRRGVQFLDLGDQDRNRRLTHLLAEIALTLASDSSTYGKSSLRLFQDHQRALGELMLEPVHGDARGFQCMTYVDFTKRLEGDQEFARWFAAPAADLTEIAAHPERPAVRLCRLQSQLVDLIDFLDPDHFRFPASQLTRLAGGERPIDGPGSHGGHQQADELDGEDPGEAGE